MIPRRKRQMPGTFPAIRDSYIMRRSSYKACGTDQIFHVADTKTLNVVLTVTSLCAYDFKGGCTNGNLSLGITIEKNTVLKGDWQPHKMQISGNKFLLLSGRFENIGG